MLIVILTVALLAAFILTSLPGITRSRLGDVFGHVFDPLVTSFQNTLTVFRGYFGAVSENERLRAEVLKLEEEKARLNLEILQNRNRLTAYEELKEALRLTTIFEDRQIHGAAVLNRELGPSFDLIRIKAGRVHGILPAADTTLPVIDQNMALIGRIHSSELTSSKVLPLIHEAFAVSAQVEGSYRASFRIRGDLELQEQGLCLADNIAEGISIRSGDRLVTSGDSGIYPEGILIGQVVEIRYDNGGNILHCLVRPAADFTDLRYVFVMTEPDDES